MKIPQKDGDPSAQQPGTPSPSRFRMKVHKNLDASPKEHARGTRWPALILYALPVQFRDQRTTSAGSSLHQISHATYA